MIHDHEQYLTFAELNSRHPLRSGGDVYPDKLLELLVQSFWRGDFPNDRVKWNERAALRELFGADSPNEESAKSSGRFVELAVGYRSVRRAVFGMLVDVGWPVAETYMPPPSARAGKSTSGDEKASSADEAKNDMDLDQWERDSFEDLATLPLSSYDSRARTVLGHIAVHWVTLQRWYIGRNFLLPGSLKRDSGERRIGGALENTGRGKAGAPKKIPELESELDRRKAAGEHPRRQGEIVRDILAWIASQGRESEISKKTVKARVGKWCKTNNWPGAQN